MTPSLYVVALADGSEASILVETDVADGVELAGSRSPGRVQVAAVSLAAALGQVAPVLDTIIAQVRSTVRPPDEIGVELGLTIGGEHGIILTKGTAEANLKLTVKWLPPGRPPDPAGPEEPDPPKPDPPT